MPINVTSKDHENEVRLADLLLKHFSDLASIELCQDDLTSPWDGLALNVAGKKTILEFRCRESYSCDQLESWGPFINLHKLWPLIHAARSSRTSARFIVLASDGILVYNLYDVADDRPLDGRMSLEFERPARRVERNQARNDSCFAACLRNPIKKLIFEEQHNDRN